MNANRRGSGKPLLLIHGLGGSWRSWNPIVDALARERETIAIDLPGFGASPPLAVPTFLGLADAVQTFLGERSLDGIDVVGSSMGARLVLELARRGAVGRAVALDPGGFWRAAEKAVFVTSVRASIALLRAVRPALPLLTANVATRTALLAQFSARPWALSPAVARDELQSFVASPSFDAILNDLVDGPSQQGAPRGSLRSSLAIGWGKRDLVCFPSQAARALEAFPDARLHWFEACGHFPQWDAPEQTVRFVLEATAT